MKIVNTPNRYWQDGDISVLLQPNQLIPRTVKKGSRVESRPNQVKLTTTSGSHCHVNAILSKKTPITLLVRQTLSKTHGDATISHGGASNSLPHWWMHASCTVLLRLQDSSQFHSMYYMYLTILPPSANTMSKTGREWTWQDHTDISFDWLDNTQTIQAKLQMRSCRFLPHDT